MFKLDSVQRFFITGGAGFIGSHLADRFLREGKSVTVYDNMSTGRKYWVEAQRGKPNFHFVQADLLDLETLTHAMKDHDFVWHLGANPDIPGGMEKTDLDIKNGTLATRHVLEAMRLNKVPRVVYASSSTVYGELSLARVAETAGPSLPISLYGASKMAGEGLMSAYGHLFGIQSWIFRFGNVLGHRMNHGVVFDFIHKLAKNPRELEVLGDGNQEKNYFLVEECLEGMYWVIQNSDRPYDVYNLGSETTVKVHEIARIVIEEMGLSHVNTRYTGGKMGWPGDVPAVIYNVDKVTRLGWQALHSSEEAIRITARRLMEEVQVPVSH